MGQKGRTLQENLLGHQGIVRKVLDNVPGKFHHSSYRHPKIKKTKLKREGKAHLTN